MLFLSRAYQAGDLSHVYPLARGNRPLIVAAVSIGLLGEQLGPTSQMRSCLSQPASSLVLTRDRGAARSRPTLFALGRAVSIVRLHADRRHGRARRGKRP